MSQSTDEFRAFQRRFFQSLRDRPLDLAKPEDRKLYQPLYENQDENDPVRRLYDTIDFSEVESVQLVAGFRGTGKTTEFSRLEERLYEGGYRSVLVDLDEYLDMRMPVDVVTFLLQMSGAIVERMQDKGLIPKVDGLQKSYLDRIRKFLPDGVEVKGVDFMGFKMELKADRSLRQKIQESLQDRLPALVEQVHEFHAELLQVFRDHHGDLRLVVIIDSLEHLRGHGEGADEIRRSIEELFFVHGKHLNLPDTHLIISVPAFLALKADNLAAEFINGQVQSWPACKVQDRVGNKVPENLDRLVRLVDKRGDWKKILPDREALEKIILASGGYLRDLLNMLVEALHLAGRGIAKDAAERIISVAERAYQPLYKDEIDVLKRITQDKSLRNVDSTKEHEYVLRFLDAHVVLCYLNKTFWYDVHPLVRELVLKP